VGTSRYQPTSSDRRRARPNDCGSSNENTTPHSSSLPPLLHHQRRHNYYHFYYPTNANISYPWADERYLVRVGLSLSLTRAGGRATKEREKWYEMMENTRLLRKPPYSTIIQRNPPKSPPYARCCFTLWPSERCNSQRDR